MDCQDWPDAPNEAPIPQTHRFTLGVITFEIVAAGDDVSRIDIHGAEGCSRESCILQDVDLGAFSEDRRALILDALHAAEEDALELAAFEGSVDEFQATLRIIEGSQP